MDTKISSRFWSKREVEDAPKEVKYAALWLLTNERVSLCGYAEVTEKRFVFETGLSTEDMARAFEALPKTFIKVGKGYLARNFIRWQFGHGPALAKSHMSVPIVNALRVCPEEVVAQVLALYPELTERFEEATRKALAEGIGSPSEAQRARAGAGERAGTRARAGAQGGTPRRNRSKPGGALPLEFPEPMQSRMIAVGALKHRDVATVWGANEIEAFRAQRLDSLSEEDFEAQRAVLAAYYGAAIPREKDFRRRELLTLLNHWAGELDKAKAWVRDNDDGLKRM
jgi:hypothetical protein